MNDITFRKFYGFKSVVVLGLAVGPTAAVGADHVGPVAQRSENERVFFGLNYLSMAKP